MYTKLFLSAFASVAFAQNADLTSVLSGNSDLSSLVALIKTQPQLLASLGSAKNITILAPNNAALAGIANSSLASNSAAVAALLSYHVLNGTYASTAVSNTSAFIPTLLNDKAYSNVTGGQVVQALLAHNNVSIISGLLQNSTVTQADINFTGGTVHVINKVLTIPTNVSDTLVNSKLTAAYGALNATNLLGAVNGLKDVTIFAPSNAAFSNIGSILANASTDTLVKTLQYHVISGPKALYSTSLSNTTVKTLEGAELTVRIINGSVFINGAKVITPDVLIAGGVVHVIDQILNPSNTTATPSGTAGVVAFSGESSVTDTPFTSGVPSPAISTGGGAAGATGTSTSKAGAAVMTAAPMGVAALIGAAGMLLI